MLESRQISHNVVLPTLEAAGMVSSVKDVDTDTIQVSSQPDPEPDNHDEAAHTSHPVIRYNSPWRFSRLLSLVIPPLLAAFILYGWYFASRFVIPYLCSTYPGYICMIYTLTFHTLLATTTGLFFFIWLLPNSHSATPPVLPHLLRAKLVPHEVATQEGGYTECWQDNCKGRIIPPRARHCKDCRVCRLEFDHHCPWLGCIARDTFKAFILFLGFATVSIEVGLAPVYSLAWKQYNFVTDLAWEQDWMYNIWWNRIYSWLGGPMYRFLGAIFLSYSRYDNKSPSNIRANPTGSVPISAALVFYTILGTVLAIFCAILFVSSCRDAIYALSTIEIARQNKRRRLGPDCKPAYRYIQLPGHAIGGKDNDEAAIEVRNVPLNMNLYDFGLIGNLKRIFGRSMVEYLSPWPPYMEPSDHWLLSNAALKYLDIPIEEKESDHKRD